ncbi:MAG: hypothetical protein ABIJ44_07515 [Pseudomonadota bacterium]
MNTVKVSVRLVDGGLIEFTKASGFLRELQSLQSQGYTGKQLVHRLLTDDWGAPPVAIEISGQSPDGQDFEVRIPYA